MNDSDTRLINPQWESEDIYNSLRPPLYDSVAFDFESSRDIQLAFEGRKKAFAYSRVNNPTVAELEKRIQDLSGSIGVIALSSGMAAISNAVLALAGSGTNGVIARTLFGNSVSLFKETLGPWGFESRFVDMTDPAGVEAAIDEDTRFIFLEIISNPQLEVADIREIVDVGNRRGVPVILDGTLTTPYIFNAKAAGVALEIISSTKYISGGATSTGGLILDYGNFDWGLNPLMKKWSQSFGPMALLVRLRREVFRNIGACLAPHNAWLQILGLETLGLRIDRSCENAMAVSEWLTENGKISRVDYPGLKNSEYHSISIEQFGSRFGGILTFDLKDRETAFRFMDSLQLIRRATNLNDNKSLILHPATTIFSEYSKEECDEMGVRDTMIRLSVGIESYKDLISDIRQALDKI